MKSCLRSVRSRRILAGLLLSATALFSACSFDSSLNGLECNPEDGPQPGMVCQEGYWRPDDNSELDAVTDTPSPLDGNTADVTPDIMTPDAGEDTTPDVEQDTGPDAEECPAPMVECGGECVDLLSDPRLDNDGLCETGQFGICSTGTLECMGGEVVCTPGQEAAEVESCGDDGTGTGRDDNCNGAVDENCANCEEGTTRECYFGPAGTSNNGVCSGGEQTCLNGDWGSCGGDHTTPIAEICDDRDNNCDGDTDNDIAAVGAPCTVGVGLCESDGLTVCDPSRPGIDPNRPGIVCDAPEKTQSTYYLDSDNDGYGDSNETIEDCAAPQGYVDNSLDCDDTNSLIHPGAEEVCDDTDHNCNGTSHEGFFGWDENCTIGQGACESQGKNICTTDGSGIECNAPELPKYPYYPDSDGDGFGDINANATMDCAQPDGHVEDNTDCDDSRTAINPNAEEVCDNIDNNCVDGIDDNIATVGDSCTVGADDCANTGQKICDGVNAEIVCDAVPKAKTTYYFDGDQDGYGLLNYPRELCAPDIDNQYTATDVGDCKDTDPNIYPGADEVCDGEDNNCDGDTDEGSPTDLCTGDDAGLSCIDAVCCNSSTSGGDRCNGQSCSDGSGNGNDLCQSGDCHQGECRE